MKIKFYDFKGIMKITILAIIFFMIILSIETTASNITGDPLVNPLSNFDAYNSVEYTEKENLEYLREFSYKKSDDRYAYLYLWGDLWYFHVPISEEYMGSENPLRELNSYLEGLGADFLVSNREEIVATIQREEGEIWWVFAKFPTDQYELWVVKGDILLPGNMLLVAPPVEGRICSFVTYNESDKFLSYQIDIPDGKYELRASSQFAKGEYESRSIYRKELSAEKSKVYYLDDIPQQKGWVSWELYCIEEGKSNLTFSLQGITDIPPIKIDNNMGTLQIKGSSFGQVWVEPSFPIDITFPNYYPAELHGTADIDGNIVFWLPPGYWDVKVDPDNYTYLMNCTANLIPVSSGSITRLELPPSLTTAYANPSDIINSIGVGGMEIQRLEELEVDKKDEKDETDRTDKAERTDENTTEGKDIKRKDAIIDFVLEDRAAVELSPTVENTEIFESGISALVKEVEQVKTPADIVLLLDSSGSMKEQMGETLTAARKFVESLPDDTNIQVIDFDTEPRILDGDKKETVLESLKGVKANGATALYDSVITGLNMLDERNRPTLLVFTDGVDANYDDSGPGSIATIDEVVSVVQESDVPIYTIGFGPNHDNKTLTRLADLSGGRYYPAADPAALENVFAAIKENLGNTYRAVYERPTVAGVSDLPVIFIVVDTSGSMDISPEEEGCGYRIQKVKNLLHNFVMELPEQSLVQIMDFNYDPFLTQMLTPHKEQLLQALGELKAEGGTCIMESTEAAYLALREIPSSNKVMLYITDAALNVEVPEIYEELLTGIKEDNIKSIWIGVGLEEEEDIFADTAKKSGGRYVVSEDFKVLENTFDEVLKEIREAPVNNGRTLVRLSISQLGGDNRIYSYTDSEFADFKKPTESDEKKIPEGLNYEIVGPGDNEEKEDEELSGVYTSALNGQVRNIPLDAAGSNQAVKIEVKQAAFFKRFDELELPPGYQFMSLDMKLSNILPEQEIITYPDGGNHPSAWLSGSSAPGAKKVVAVPQYVIPDISSHLFVNWNNNSSYPVSSVSWLSKKSMIKPGEYSLTVKEGEVLEGECIFVVPDEVLDNLSLRYYDTAYGHSVIPLVGNSDSEELINGIDQSSSSLKELPQAEPVRLSDAFSIIPTVVEDIEEISGVRAADWNSVFRVVELDLISNVQSLLDISPEQVFSLSISTEEGEFFIPLNQLTENLPMGFARQTMITPGSFNKIRLAFQVPQALSEEQCSLYINMKKDDIIIPLELSAEPGSKAEIDSEAEGLVDVDKKVQGDVEVDRDEYVVIVDSNEIAENSIIAVGERGKSYKGDAIELVINNIISCQNINKQSGNWVVADITLNDQPDDFETSLFDAFKLVKMDQQGGIEGDREVKDPGVTAGNTGLDSFADNMDVPDILSPADITGELLFGFDDQSVIINGTSRRGFVAFQIAQAGLESNWSLQSDIFPGLNIPLDIAEKNEEGKEVFKYNGKYKEEGLLVSITRNDPVMNEYRRKLGKTLEKAVNQYQLIQSAQNKIELKGKINLDAEIMMDPPPVPKTSLGGLAELNEIKSIDELIQVVEGLRWLPSPDSNWIYRYAPEAVLTQGWGTEFDLAGLFEQGLKQLGYIPNREYVVITEEGYQKLSEMGNKDIQSDRHLPALGYIDSDGSNHLYVLPFMKEISELGGLVNLSGNSGDIYSYSPEIGIAVTFKVEAKEEGVASQFADIGSALAGNTGENPYLEIHVLSANVPMDTLSLDAVDLGYTRVGSEYGDLITAVIVTVDGKLIGDEHVDTGLYKIRGVSIEIGLPDYHLTREITLNEDEGVDGLFHTMAINLPDIRGKAVDKLQSTADYTYNLVKKPELISSLRWYTRSIINRFIVSQSEYEDDLARKLDLTIGRLKNPRCLMVTIRKSGAGENGNNKLRTSIDLMRYENEFHSGEKEAHDAFNILSGVFASKLEAEVIPDRHLGLSEYGVNYLQTQR